MAGTLTVRSGEAPWTQEEHRILEEGLERFPASEYTTVSRYILIAKMLRHKTVRDVAHRILLLKGSNVYCPSPSAAAPQLRVDGTTGPGPESPPSTQPTDPRVSVLLDSNARIINAMRNNLMCGLPEQNIMLMARFRSNVMLLAEWLDSCPVQMPALPVTMDDSLIPPAGPYPFLPQYPAVPPSPSYAMASPTMAPYSRGQFGPPGPMPYPASSPTYGGPHGPHGPHGQHGGHGSHGGHGPHGGHGGHGGHSAHPAHAPHPFGQPSQYPVPAGYPPHYSMPPTPGGSMGGPPPGTPHFMGHQSMSPHGQMPPQHHLPSPHSQPQTHMYGGMPPGTYSSTPMSMSVTPAVSDGSDSRTSSIRVQHART